MNKQKPLVILVTYHFPPFEGIGGARPFRFYKYLTRAGHDCEVITSCRQNGNPPGIHFVPDHLADIWENPEKQRLSLKAHLERLIRRIVFPGEVGILWSLDAARICRQIIARYPGRPVVVFSTFPPTAPLLVGLMMTLQYRIPWISDFRDPMSIDPTLHAWPRFTRFVLRRLEALTFRRAAALIANVEGAAEIWRQMYPSARAKLHVIWNGFDPEDQMTARPAAQNGPKVLIHAGTLYEGRNPNQIVASLMRLRRKNIAGARETRIVLLGLITVGAGIDQALCDEAVAEGWLEFRSAVPSKEARRLTEQAESLLLLQPQTAIQVPGKLFDYICIGRPILALAPAGSGIETILSKAGVPYVCVYPDEPAEITDEKLLRFLDLPGDPVPASEWFRNTFDGQIQAGHLASVIDSLAPSLERRREGAVAAC